MATETCQASPPQAVSVARRITFRNAIMLAALALFWTFVWTADGIESSMFVRFVTRMAVNAGLLLFALAWWTFNSALSRGERLWGFAATLAAWLLVPLACDPTLTRFGLVLLGLPLVFTFGLVWLLVAAGWTPRVRLTGLTATVCLTFGFFALVRWDGLDGGQHAVLHWRWEPTPEQLFLASSRAAAEPGQAAPEPVALTVEPGDWPEFRGPARDGQVRDVHVARDWKARPPQLKWRERVGPAWSSMALVGGRLFTQEQRGDSEAVVCYDAASGKQVWVHASPARFYEPLSGPGPRGTPTFAAGRLYAFGARGRLDCLDAATGRLQWTHDVVEDAGAAVPQWGYSNSPLVTDGLVLAFAGGEGKSLLAYDGDSGRIVWTFDAGKMSYSSPQIVSLGGQRQILMAANSGIVALDLTGKLLWKQKTEGVLEPVIQPQRVAGDDLIVQTASGIARLNVVNQGGEWIVSERWASRALKPSLNDCVVYEGSIYGFDDGKFACVDLETGARRWKGGRYGHGQVLLLADQGLLLVLSETGAVVLLAANPQQLEELASFPAIEGKTWNHPVLVRGRLYVRNNEEMACYEVASEGASGQ